MKNALLALLMFVFLMPAAACGQEGKTVTVAPAYSSIAADLPLMPGLTERPDSLVLFDKAEGRIAEITMTSTQSQIDVLAYYAETLPALGWYAENPQVWRRRGEELTVRFNDDKSVTFHLEPQSPAGRSRLDKAPGPAAPDW